MESTKQLETERLKRVENALKFFDELWLKERILDSKQLGDWLVTHHPEFEPTRALGLARFWVDTSQPIREKRKKQPTIRDRALVYLSYVAEV